MNTIFYISTVIAIISTALAITRANAIHAVLNLVVSFLAVGVVLFSLGSPFAAALEVIIYAGAIMVVFVFVVMMLKNDSESTAQENLRLQPRVWIIPGIFSALLLCEVLWLIGAGSISGNVHPGKSPLEVGAILYGPYLLGVELVSIVLMTGLVGACHLGRKPESEPL